MKNFKNFKTGLEEAIYASDYTTHADKGHKGGYRAQIKHKTKGHTMYHGGGSYKKPEHAKGEADTYLSAYSKSGDRAANKAVQNYRTKNKAHMHESVDYQDYFSEDVKPPFSKPYKTVKPGQQRKDRFGNPIKNMAKHLAKKGLAGASKKEEVEEGLQTKSKAAAALHDYGTKSGGIDKKDFHHVAGKLAHHSETGNPGAVHQAAKHIRGMDTDPRDKVMSIIKKHDPAMHRSIMHKAGLKEETEFQIDEAVEVKLRGGKVPVGQHRFKYDVDKSDKYIENSIKERDKNAKVERKGKDLWVTASAGAHSSVIASLRRFSANGTISEEVEIEEAVGSAAKYADKKGMFGGKYTHHDRAVTMKGDKFDKWRDKQSKKRSDAHKAQDPKMAKRGYAQNIVDTGKAQSKAAKKGLGKQNISWQQKNSVKRGKLPESVELDEAGNPARYDMIKKAAQKIDRQDSKAARAAAKSDMKKPGATKGMATTKKEDNDPCWKDYEMVGMKDKNGKKVPNCVPKEEKETNEGMYAAAQNMMVSKMSDSSLYTLAKKGGAHAMAAKRELQRRGKLKNENVLNKSFKDLRK